MLKAYNKSPDAYAKYAYDMVALTAGITSALGPQGLTTATLQNKSGFRGSTGYFRFKVNGEVERQIGLYKVESGVLKQAVRPIKKFN